MPRRQRATGRPARGSERDEDHLTVRGLTYRYGSGGGVTDVSLTVPAGVMAAITGPSGSGKSTLLAALALTLTPTVHAYRIGGRDVLDPGLDEPGDPMRTRIAMVLQDHGLLPYLNAWENVAAAWTTPSRRHREVALDVLRTLGVGDLADRAVSELSGGERQRVAVARAWAARPSLLLADEPTGSLDPDSRSAVMTLLADLTASGVVVLVATHDPAVVALCDRSYRLDGGTLTT